MKKEVKEERMMKSMMAITSMWGRNVTFRLIPISLECPYMEVIYDPEAKALAIISKIPKSTYHMLPKLDDNGDEEMAKRKRPNGKNIKEERRLVESFQEFYILTKPEIEQFLSGICINDYNFSTYLDAPPAAPEGPKGKAVQEKLTPEVESKINEVIQNTTTEQIIEATKDNL